MKIVRVETHDVRFPTSREGAGSDALHTDCDYSAAVAILHTDADGPEGHGFAFTLGRGTEVVVAAIEALAPIVVGADVDELLAEPWRLHRRLTSDSQLRWLGPETGVVQLAAGALAIALWDLAGKLAEKPVWRLLADRPPDELVRLVDFRYLDDALPPEDALGILEAARSGRREREARLAREGIPAYVTSAGWLGYPDATIETLAREAVEAGFEHLKMKVGRSPEDDRRRAGLLREIVGPDRRLSMDANQAWGVREAIERVRALADLDPFWIEEPTSPHDVLGHRAIRDAVAPIRVATGEHAANRVVFKQLLAAGAIDVCQPDVCRLGGPSEVLAVLLLAARHGTPVCPHAGGVGLCELVQHVAALDAIAVSGRIGDREAEFADHLHEHFVDPVRIEGGRYALPETPGFGSEMKRASLETYAFPDGAAWRAAG